MNEIKRYSVVNLGFEDICIEEDVDGDYVIYSDHKQALAQKEADCADLRERVKTLENDLPPINKRLLQDIMMCIAHCDEEPGKDGLCNCAWQIGTILRRLEKKYRKQIADLTRQLEEARKVLEPIKNVHSTYSDENKRHNTFAFMEDAWNTIKQAALAGKGNENKQNIDKPYCPKCQGTGWIVLDGSACPYCNPDGSWRSIFKGKKL